MLAREFWQRVVRDRADLLPRLLAALDGTRYCVIGGVAVNAYVEPHITLDFDLVIHADDLAAVEQALEGSVTIERFGHSTNISAYDSGMRVQISTDARYEGAIERAGYREVLGVQMRVAALPDVLQGKIWASMSESRRPRKRQKDLFDIARLLDEHPELRERVPPDILAKLPD